jgi:thiol:disulfide interchange protein
MAVERSHLRGYGGPTMQYTRSPYFSALACFLMATAAFSARSAERDLYPPPTQAPADIAAAIKNSAVTHKRVILDFGGNWCTDCHVLDSYFHDSANNSILVANYILVHVNIGRLDANVNITEQYQIPLKKGVPAIAVLSDRGKLLYSQRTGEFEAMRHMQSGAVTEFLLRWKRPAS